MRRGTGSAANYLAPPLQGRGWGGAYPLGASVSVRPRRPTPNPSPEGEGLEMLSPFAAFL
ncbi:MAG: hypothetical protein B7Y97_10150 [Sphingomonas sp. 32-66-10]|nr:MAG: hypothetical protein B7Y97_10150 [Sphingomonas sp. 32-66-10]